MRDVLRYPLMLAAVLLGLVVQVVAVATVVGIFCPAYAPPTNWPQDPSSWKDYKPWEGRVYANPNYPSQPAEPSP